MSEKIKPALSAEEWAAHGTTTARLVGGKLYTPSDCGGEPYGEDVEHDRMALAALCLHGRISWEMVDALRTVAAKLAWTDDEPYLTIVANLLERLLPPREP